MDFKKPCPSDYPKFNRTFFCAVAAFRPCDLLKAARYAALVRKVGLGGVASLTLLALFLKNLPTPFTTLLSLGFCCVVVGRLSKFDHVDRNYSLGGVIGRSGSSSPNAADGILWRQMGLALSSGLSGTTHSYFPLGAVQFRVVDGLFRSSCFFDLTYCIRGKGCNCDVDNFTRGRAMFSE